MWARTLASVLVLVWRSKKDELSGLYPVTLVVGNGFQIAGHLGIPRRLVVADEIAGERERSSNCTRLRHRHAATGACAVEGNVSLWAHANRTVIMPAKSNIGPIVFTIF